MAIRANVDKQFIRRFLFIAIGCFLFMLWALYDSLVSSPKGLAASQAYIKLEEQQANGEITESQRAKMWDEMAGSNGWRTSHPESVIDAQNDVYFQWFLFGTGLLLGIFFLLKYFRLLYSWIEADKTGVSSSWGQSLQFDKIQQINKQKWAKKGIAKIHYIDESGATKVMTFDDFKYDRKSMAQIMTRAEQDLEVHQIICGPQKESDPPLEH